MNYYLYECSRNNGGSMTAGVKAREDVETILDRAGFSRLTVLEATAGHEKLGEKLRSHVQPSRQWAALLKKLKGGDTFFLQLPLSEHTALLFRFLALLERRGVRVIALIHDLECLRQNRAGAEAGGILSRGKMFLEEQVSLRHCHRIIVHNPVMAAALEKQGIGKEKLVSLGLFDYLMEDAAPEELSPLGDPEGIVIAGNLSPEKAGYVYHLPEEGPSYNLYGVNFAGARGKRAYYYGAFTPEALPHVLRGRFGLVWDGPSAESCEGIYGEYLRLNDPHKTSLYLAAGLPLILWREAALAPWVEEQGLGITVASLHEIREKLAALSGEEIAAMAQRAAAAGKELRRGGRLKAALAACGVLLPADPSERG